MQSIRRFLLRMGGRAIVPAKLRVLAAVVWLVSLATPALARLGVEYQMALGNPDGAITDPASRTKYLLQRSQYALSYNDDTHLANWVSWSYSREDIGADVARTDAFATDADLPLEFLRIGPDSFGSVYDRGHLCSSEDRVFSTDDNRMTFKMSNMIPQAYANNRGLWSNFEAYCRGLATNSAVVSQNNEVLVLAGPVVTPSSASLFNSMKIPDSIWKIAVVVPGATSTTPAAGRITAACRVIALLVPNRSDNLLAWQDYIVSVEEIEAVTGFDFFSAVDASSAVYLKNVVDTGTGPNNPTVITGFSPVSGTPGTLLTISGYNFGPSPTVDFNGVEVVGSPVAGNSGQITATVPSGAVTGSIAVTGSGGTDHSYGIFTVFTGTEPLYSLSTPSITGLTSIAGKAGSAKSYTLSGANLSGDLTVQATSPFEVSLSSSGPFSGQLTVPTGSGTLAGYPVWVRIGTAGAEGALSGTIAHSGGNAPAQTMQVSGSASSPAPKLTLSASTLGGLFASQGKTGLSKVYFLSGVNLSNPINVSFGASTNFEVSTNNSNFALSQLVQPVNEAISNLPLYVRISSNAATGSISASLSHSATGIPGTNLSVLGSVTVKQYLAAWDFFGESDQASSMADIRDDFLDVVSELSRGPGANSSTGGNSFRTLGFKNDGISTTNIDYFQFSLSVTNGKTLSVSSVGARFVGTTTYFASPGVTNQFAYSTNGTNYVLAGSPILVPSTNTLTLFDLSQVTELQNLSANTTVFFRFYASGQTSSGGWGFSSSAAGNYGLAVEGKVASLPPVITSPAGVDGTARAAFLYQITASNNPTYFSASGLPEGLTVDPHTGLIFGNPTVGGTYAVLLTASNDGGDGTATLTLTVSDPTIFLSTTNLSGLSSLVGSPGSSRSYSLSGSSLTGSVTLSPSSSFEISADNSLFANSLTLSPSNGILSARTLFVRLKNTATQGLNTGTILHAGGGALDQVLQISGTANQPVITLSVASLTGLSCISGSASGFKTYAVSGSYLTESVTLALPADSKFELSTDGVSFSGSAFLLPNAGGVNSQPVYVRLKASAPEGIWSETITHSGGGALIQSLAVSGVVAKPPASLILSTNTLAGITSVAGASGSSQSYAISGAGLTNVVKIAAPTGFELSTNGSNFSGILTLNPAGGNLGSTTIQIRIGSNAMVGSLTGSVAHTSLGALPKDLQVAGTVASANKPVINSFLYGAVYTNSSFSYTITATNPSGSAAITYGASNLPSGWAVNSSSGVLSGTAGTNSTNLIFNLWAANTNGTNFAAYRLKVLSQSSQDAIPLNVVINKYLNDSNGDRVELLVTGDSSGDPAVDLRGMILKDFSSSMGGDSGGRYLFQDVPLWASVKAGTLITLSVGNKYTEDLDGSDFKIFINLNNALVIQPLGGSFDIGNTDMVMLKAAETGPDGVAGGIHAVSAGSAGTYFTAFKGKKMNSSTSLSSSKPLAYARNAASVLTDYFTNAGVSVGSALSFGVGNNTQNKTYISNLQGLDQVGPIVTLAGSNPMTVVFGGAYVDPGAVAQDAKDGSRPVTLSGSVDLSMPGSYPIAYSASDLAGNQTTVVRTVLVVDQTPPLLTLGGSSIMKISVGSVFEDPGAFAADGWDGPLPYSVVGSVNTSVPGNYVLSYSAVDTSGNASADTIRTVQVLSELQSWADGFGLTGANTSFSADSDGDGWSNAQEYAFGLDPTNAGGSPASLTQTTNQVKLTFLQKDTGGIAYAVKSATSLNGGFTNSITPQLSANTNGVPAGYKRYEATISTTNGRGFLKVEATIP